MNEVGIWGPKGFDERRHSISRGETMHFKSNITFLPL